MLAYRIPRKLIQHEKDHLGYSLGRQIYHSIASMPYVMLSVAVSGRVHVSSSLQAAANEQFLPSL